MASLWQKTMFYLGLVDEDDADSAVESDAAPPQARVRTVEAPRQVRQPAAPESLRRPAGSVAGRRVEPPARQRRPISANPDHAEAGVLVRSAPPPTEEQPVTSPPPSPSMHAESEIIEARTFSDAQMLADHVRDGRPVVLDLRGTEPAMVRRLVDFSTGLTYALDGRMAKIAQGVILVTSHGATLGLEEQRRLAELGLYSAES